MASTTNKWLVLVAMTGALSMIMLDQTVVAVALPSMTDDLGLSPTGATWVINAYVLAMASLIALGGKLGDLLGSVHTFRLGVITFFLASVACGLAPAGELGEPWIIASRALQGAGAALMMPASAAIVINAFEARERGRAMSIYTGISQIFLALGPLLGGYLTEAVSWRAVFWLNVPVGLGALVMVRLARPVDTRRAGSQIRATSVALLVAGLALTVLGIQQGSTWGWTATATLTTLAVGVVLTASFVTTQLRTTDPLVDLRLLAQRAFVGNVVVLTLVQFGLLAVVLYSSLYQQDLLGLSPMQSGLGILPVILALAATAQVGGRWYDRRGVRRPTICGLTLSIFGLVAWAIALPSLSYSPQVPGMIVTGAGLGLIMSPTNTDALANVTVAKRSQASGLVQTARQLGGTLGVAVIGAVILALEHDGTASATPQDAADAITVGFLCASAAFVIALIAAWRLLRSAKVDGSSEADDNIAWSMASG